MDTLNTLFPLLWLSISVSLLFSSLPYAVVAAGDQAVVPNREVLKIIIGGGSGDPSPAPSPDNQECAPPPPPPCPPPPPPPCPPPPPPRPPPPKARPPPPIPSPFENERIKIAYHVLQKFKSRVTDDPWHIIDTWVGKDLRKYKGVYLEPLPHTNTTTLAGINFNGKSLGGPQLTLDGFIDQLPDLVFFHANSNGFRGGIPKKISQLRYFYELDLSNNKLSGAFPTEVLGATQLTFLDLRFNNLYGSVPPQLFTLDVGVIFINNNHFTQQLPENLGSTPANFITFANNNFTGPIPSSIGQAKKTLIEILFLNNSLSGCLPYEIGFLENAVLFDVSKNKLTGPIPYSFACLAKMQLLNLADNQFYGPVPEIVCKLPKIGNLTLKNNYFTQVGPECRKLIKNNVIDVTNNCILDLPKQRSKEDCAWFFSKPKYCPNERLLSIIPCKTNYYLNSKEASSPAANGNRSDMRTYGTLIP